MASLLDPFGLVGRATSVVRTSTRTGTRAVTWTERQVWGILRSRLDQSAPAALPAGPSRTEPLDAKMNRLLDRALEQSTTSSRQELFHKILDRIVPDEARIIGAMSDGSAFPLIHVHAWSRAGILGDAAIENASLVGKMANVSLPHLTPTYVGHLLSLGLVESGPEDPTMKDEYQILMADSGVLKAIRGATRGKIAPRIDKHTLRLSPLGKELWAATNPGIAQ